MSVNANKEYALAHSALSRAKEFLANKNSPKMYSKALLAYKEGVSLHKRQNYEEAKNFFEIAIHWAEKSEFKARLKRLKEADK